MQLLKLFVQSCKRNFQDVRFLTKFVAMLLNLANILLWRIPERSHTGMLTVSQTCLWAHTVPAYMLVLGALVVIYLLGEQPERRFHRIFMVSGTILFTATGIVTIVNKGSATHSDEFAITIGVLCFIIAIILFVDELMNEGIFKFCKRKDQAGNSE